MGIFTWIGNNKLASVFAVSTAILLIATIVLAVQKSQVTDCNTQTKLRMKTTEEYLQRANTPDLSQVLNYRLPKNVIPTNYRLVLRPNLAAKVFQGNVSISLDILIATEKITLHSKDLNISAVSLSNYNNEYFDVSHTTSDDSREFLYIKSEKGLHEGKNYTLQIIFAGRLDSGITGFYSSRLKSGELMVASKFQPTYTRQAFPCFDEPDFKATFDTTLIKPSGYVALSNMNEISKTVDKENNAEAVTFATSVPMSTYLACFVICNFEFKEMEINAKGVGKNFQLRSFTQKNEMHKIDFALDVGKRATEYYIQYYDVPFPLPKLDMIAIPDYISGATEHWGLITYRETSFLIDEATASASNKISVANTIAHELAHMWFGNLVTLKWWDDLWLNEGFASYMQVKALNAIEPTWTMLELFLTRTLHSVLVIDAKLSSHPIVQTVATPNQITAIFDAISYNKGASILRMLEGFIGAENFRRGVSDYLKKYEFGNTVTQDLLSQLEPYFKKSYSTLNLTYIMDTWTKQMGYPLLTVAKGNAPNTYVITQTRFLLDPTEASPNNSPFNYRWFVPITYKTNSGTNEKVTWFSDADKNVTLILNDGDSWLKLNNDQVGYYRVNYPLDMWDSLIRELKDKSNMLSISDRAHLLNEVFALADSRHVPYSVALNLTTYLTTEEDYVPWETASSIFSIINNRIFNCRAYNDFKKYVQRLVNPLYHKQSWEQATGGVIDRLLRVRILLLAARMQLPDAETKVRELFLRWLENHGTSTAVTIEPDLRELVYNYGMKTSTQAEWDKLWQIYLKEEDAHEQTKLRNALAAPRDACILNRYLLLAWEEKNIRGQDYLNVIQQIAANPSGTALVWDDVRTRWPQLVERFTLNSRYLGNMIPRITSHFNSELKLKEMETFFEEYPEAGAGEAARARALETVRTAIRWRQSNEPALAAWLADSTKTICNTL